jgi:type 1 glutamine amidotransferase
MRVLLICDDYWHPGQVPIDGVAPLREQGFQFDTISNANDFKSETLSEYPVVLLVKSDQVSQADNASWKTEAVQKAFIAYVENGGGLLAVHSGTVPSKVNSGLELLLGCRFTGHPEACPVTVQPLKPHPVTEGVGMFCEKDEHYRLEILSPDVDILIASYSAAQGTPEKYKEDPGKNTPASICPAGCVRTQGKGRVCVLTPGHLLPVWLNPNFQRTLSNALRWCGGE